MSLRLLYHKLSVFLPGLALSVSMFGQLIRELQDVWTCAANSVKFMHWKRRRDTEFFTLS
jgi:hypothetical protein